MRETNSIALAVILIVVSAWVHYGIGVAINAPQKCGAATGSDGKIYTNCTPADLQIMLLASWAILDLAICFACGGLVGQEKRKG